MTVVFPLFDGARPGMTANVSVVVDKCDVALVVPDAVIATIGECAEVVVITGSHQIYRQVKVGSQGDTLSEVVSGLAPGERIRADKPLAMNSTPGDSPAAADPAPKGAE